MDRQLTDTAALAGHLVPAGSMFAFLAAHRAPRHGSGRGTDQAVQRPLRLHRPDSSRVAFGAVLEVAQPVRQARLIPGDMLPPGD